MSGWKNMGRPEAGFSTYPMFALARTTLYNTHIIVADCYGFLHESTRSLRQTLCTNMQFVARHLCTCLEFHIVGTSAYGIWA